MNRHVKLGELKLCVIRKPSPQDFVVSLANPRFLDDFDDFPAAMNDRRVRLSHTNRFSTCVIRVRKEFFQLFALRKWPEIGL